MYICTPVCRLCGRYLAILGRPIRITVPSVTSRPDGPGRLADKVIQPTTQSAEGCTYPVEFENGNKTDENKVIPQILHKSCVLVYINPEYTILILLFNFDAKHYVQHHGSNKDTRLQGQNINTLCLVVLSLGGTSSGAPEVIPCRKVRSRSEPWFAVGVNLFLFYQTMFPM